MNRIRLAAWASLVLAISALNYAARFTSSSSSATRGGRDEVYSWSAFASGMIVYGIWLAIVLAIAVDRHDLLALRRPRSWGRAAGLCVGAVAAIYAVSAVVSVLPLPQSPSHEQGIAPTHWEPRYAGAFAANVVLFTVVAPVVEELMFRGWGSRCCASLAAGRRLSSSGSRSARRTACSKRCSSSCRSASRSHSCATAPTASIPEWSCTRCSTARHSPSPCSSRLPLRRSRRRSPRA